MGTGQRRSGNAEPSSRDKQHVQNTKTTRTVGEVGPPLTLVALAVLVLQDAVALLRVVLK